MSEQNTNVGYNAVVNFKDFHAEADALLAKIKAIKKAEKDLNQQRARTANTGAAKTADPARAAKSQEANDARRIKRLDAAQRLLAAKELRHEKSLSQAQARRNRLADQAAKIQRQQEARHQRSLDQAQARRTQRANQDLKNTMAEENRQERRKDQAQRRRDKAANDAQDERLRKEKHAADLVRAAEKAQLAEDLREEAKAQKLAHMEEERATRRMESIKDEKQRERLRQERIIAREQEAKDKQKAQETLARLNAARAALGTTNQEARDGNKFTRRPVQERSVGQVKVNYDADKDANYYQAVTRAREEELRMVERSTQAVNREMEARGALYNILRKIPAATREAGNSTSGSFRGAQRDIRRTNGLLDNFLDNLNRIGRWRPRLIPPFIALVPIIASLLALINPLVAGLGAIGGAAIGLAGSIASLAGAALGAIPALASLLSVGSALKMVFGGVGKALKAAGKANGGTGAPGTGGAPAPGSPKAPKLADQIPLEELTQVEKIQRAQESYRRSIEDVAEAQRELTEAKDDYFDRLRDIEKQIKRNALEERRAAANVQLAEENYWNVMADSGSTKGQKMDAAVGLDEAKQEAKGTTAEIKELRKELDDMRRGGVGADPAVRRAMRGVTDAIYAQRDAQIDLQNAYKGTEIAAAEQADAANAAAYEAAEAAGGVDEFAEAMAKLSPSAQAVVLALLAMQPAWEAVRKSVQERFFSEIVDDIQLLVRLFPVLETLLGNTAGALGRVASRGLRLVTSDKWLRDLNILAEQNVPLIENVGDGLLEILDMMLDLAVAAGPFYTALTEGFKEGAKNLGDLVANARETGSLANWLEVVRGRLEQWWRVIKNIGVTLFNYSAAAAPFGQWMTDGMEAMTEAWRAASEEARAAGSPFQTWLEDIKPALTEVRELFATFFKWFGREASNPENIEQFTRIIDTLTNELGPALGRIFDALSETGVGESLLDAIVQILETIAKFLEGGGAEGIKQFFDTINELFSLFADVVDRVPPDVLAGIAGTLATIAALKFFGVTNFIGSLINLAGSAGLAKLVSLFKNMSKIPKTLPTPPTPPGSPGAPTPVVTGGSGSTLGAILKAAGIVGAAFSFMSLWKGIFPEAGNAKWGENSSVPLSNSTGVPEKLQPGIFKFFTEGDGKKFGDAMSTSFLLLFPSLAKLLRGEDTPTPGGSGGGGGRNGIRAGADFKLPPIETKTGSVWGDFFGDPLTWLNEKWSGVMSWFGERAAEILAPILIIGTAVSVGWKLIWDGIVSTVQSAYETYIAPIVNGIQTLFGLLGAAMALTYALVIKPALDNVGKAFNFLKTNFVDPAMNGINRLISNIVLFGIIPILATLSAYVRTKPAEAFEAAKNGIRDAWNGIQELAKVPVRFVVDVVLGGLVAALNQIKGVKINPPKLPAGFHDGGYTGNRPAREAVGVVHGDEHVIRAQSRQKIERSNPGLLDHMNTFGEVPGYKKGGLVNPLPAGSYSVSQPYKGAAHNGIDLAAASGTKVYATGEGTVQMAQSVNMGGNEVYIQHDNGLGTRYSHLSGFASRPGDKVKPGNIIGYVGSTGMSTGPHLHYMVHNPGGGPGNYNNHQDPAGWMNGNAQELGEAWNPLQGMADFVTSKIAERFPGGGMWVDAAAGIMKQGADQAISAFTPKIGTDDSRKKGHTLFDKGGWWNGEQKPVSKLNQPEAILTTPQWESMHNISNLMSQAFGGVGTARATGSTFAGPSASVLGSTVSSNRVEDKSITIEKVEINNPVGETTNESIANTIRDATYLRG